MALTFVNQVGAIDGMNQAAPGTLIPESFVRWSQDVLFDRAGLIRRRGPFDAFKMYNPDGTENEDAFVESGADHERVIGVFSTYDPTGEPRIGILVNSLTGSINETIMRVFDNQFKFLGQEILPVVVETLSIVSAKPALGGGLWISISADPNRPSAQFQFFWRGGYGSNLSGKTGTFDFDNDNAGFGLEHGVFSRKITMNDTANISVGSFVFAEYVSNDYFIGVVKDVNPITDEITLDKRPFIWNPTVTNSHNISLSANKCESSSGTATITVNEAMLYEIGDVITLNIASAPAYCGAVPGTTEFTITAVNKTAAIGSQTFSYVLGSSPSTVNSFAGTNIIKMAHDLVTMDITDVPLKFTTFRAYDHRHGRGLITTDEGGITLESGAAGTSGEGHWAAAGVTGWNVYRASDNAYLAKVETVTDNTTASFHADPGVSMTADEYIMVLPSPTNINTDSKVSERVYGSFGGLYTAVYAGYQWYGNISNEDENVNRVVFSAAHDREAVDLSNDSADSIVFPGKSQFRGLGASSAGLLVFLEDRTYILRGNDRTNFSVEQLVPEGCLSPSSIVEYGGGVFWAGKTGIMFFDGASVRNLTKDNLGLFYSDSLDVFDPFRDRVIGFVHKNNLIMHYTAWKSPFDPIRYEPIYAADWQDTEGIADRAWDEFDPDFDYDDFFTENNTPIFWDQKKLNNPEESGSTGLGWKWNDGTDWEATTSIYKWGPLRVHTTMTLSVYLPTNALTTFSNIDFRGSTNIETVNGLKTIVGVNSVETNGVRARLIDIHPVYDISRYGEDAFLVEKINIPTADLVKGPDFYLQTKHFTVGDPILRKWFQKILLSMLLYDGAIRMDLVDDDDNDSVDINKKKHRYWEVFVEKGYDWAYLTDVQLPKIVSPNKSNWQNLEDSLTLWSELFTADFNRYSKRVAWRKPSIGLRLYQLNDYKKPFNGVVTKPNRVELQGFSIGFKPMRQGRI